MMRGDPDGVVGAEDPTQDEVAEGQDPSLRTQSAQVALFVPNDTYGIPFLSKDHNKEWEKRFSSLYSCLKPELARACSSLEHTLTSLFMTAKFNMNIHLSNSLYKNFKIKKPNVFLVQAATEDFPRSSWQAPFCN